MPLADRDFSKDKVLPLASRPLAALPAPALPVEVVLPAATAAGVAAEVAVAAVVEVALPAVVTAAATVATVVAVTAAGAELLRRKPLLNVVPGAVGVGMAMETETAMEILPATTGTHRLIPPMIVGGEESVSLVS